MRISKVIAKVTLNRKMAEVPAGSFLVVQPLDRNALAGKSKSKDEQVVLYDILAASEGDTVGLIEGAEAVAPFRPQKAPLDAYNACIFDTVDFDPVMEI